MPQECYQELSNQSLYRYQELTNQSSYRYQECYQELTNQSLYRYQELTNQSSYRYQESYDRLITIKQSENHSVIPERPEWFSDCTIKKRPIYDAIFDSFN